MEIPQNTIKMGLTDAVSCISVFRIRRAKASRLVAEPGMGSVLSNCSHLQVLPFRLWVREPVKYGSSCAHLWGLEGLGRKHW